MKTIHPGHLEHRFYIFWCQILCITDLAIMPLQEWKFFSTQQRTRNKVNTKKSEICQIDGQFLGSIQMRWNKSAALIDSNWWKKRRVGRPDEPKKSWPGQVFGPKTNPPKHNDKDRERWSDHGSLNKWWFPRPSARVRYVLAGSFVKQRYSFVQITISRLKQ